MKILHGMSDVAGQATYSVDGLRKNGEEADLVFWRRNGMGYPEIGRDMHIGGKKILYPYYALKMLAFSVPAAFRYDVYHFHFGHSLIPWALDLFWLKLMKKKTFMEFHGDDIRYFYNKTRPKYFYADTVKEPNILRVMKNNRILKHIGACITHDEELRKHIPSKRLYITPLRIDIRKLEAEYPKPDKKKPVIVHAPSDYLTKGSKYIIEAMERLRKRYEFEFILVMNKTQEEAFRIYKTADIIIDQMYAQTYGVFAVEAMALGKPVITYISDEIRKTFPPELPIFSAAIDNLEQVAEQLIRDGNLREEAGRAGRRYVEDYHDNRKVAKMQAEIYRGMIEPMSTLDSFMHVKEISL
ncbi:MAG: glycosyltransferase [Lachnospiraceae bacterium]|jgi:glycosyltransferase involved in cell wall biosynthesis|nr:glycosyltransferase [Lachnospiraceae bacterium]